MLRKYFLKSLICVAALTTAFQIARGECLLYCDDQIGYLLNTGNNEPYCQKFSYRYQFMVYTSNSTMDQCLVSWPGSSTAFDWHAPADCADTCSSFAIPRKQQAGGNSSPALATGSYTDYTCSYRSS